MKELILVFVHGYSVTNLDTYGELPLRLQNEASLQGYVLKIENIFLGRYITFSDEVKLTDVAKALQFAINEQLSKAARFICITHSTGGPLVRTWWHTYYQGQEKICPMSHLIMLAPANHGSALAQLGKTRLSRIKSWFEGLEPGQAILNWLEQGSEDSWSLNKNWILKGSKSISEEGIFPFVMTGQSIDRKLYDHINSYTGECGSDGVVRVASANLNSAYLTLQQQIPEMIGQDLSAAKLLISEYDLAQPTAMRVLLNSSHSGDAMGIMRGIKKEINSGDKTDLIKSIFKCIAVKDKTDYLQVIDGFDDETAEAQKTLKVEKSALGNFHHIHDRYTLLFFRIRDNEGSSITDLDLVLTAGSDNNPDALPIGFFADRQRNTINNNTISYFLNYDLIVGSAEIKTSEGKVLREKTEGISSLGIKLIARPKSGFVRYLPCELKASADFFQKAIRPNASTLIDICLQRLVSDEVFRFEKTDGEKIAGSYKDLKPGNKIV